MPITAASPCNAAAHDATRYGASQRDPALRERYLDAALVEIPRLLGAIDRNPYRPTYGCLDRQFWHYRTSSFPSQMYQEGVLPLALVYATDLPGNRWHCDQRVRELAIAALRFTAASSHRDGSCDDYYPFERALGAAVFSLVAAARAYQVLELDDAPLRGWLERRCRWLMRHDETGRLANHQALAALGLLRTARITGKREHADAARARIERLLEWQSDEGWFEEYGGADPGYQTLTIDCLAKCRGLDAGAPLDEPLRRAVAFARLFLHPDDSFGGEYGSRGTYHFYPHGFELLAAENAQAADLADGFLRALASGKQASLSDDRLFIHRLGNLMEAFLDWSPSRPASAPGIDSTRYLAQAGLLVRRAHRCHTVISAARGGVFKHFAPARPTITDAGLVVETGDGRVAVSQMHGRDRAIRLIDDDSSDGPGLSISGLLHWCRFETASPVKQSLFHLMMCMIGRYCRTLARRLLQRRLITGRRPCPIRLTRKFQFFPETDADHPTGLRVTDTIELSDPRISVRRMSFGTDHQAAYVAACGVYQQSVLAPWIDLEPYVEELNTRRRVVVIRER